MSQSPPTTETMTEKPSSTSKYPSAENPTRRHILPVSHDETGRLQTKGIHWEGESGRSGFHPFHFFRIMWQSQVSKVNRWLNILWPFAPAAFVLYFTHSHHYRALFATAFLGIIPAASLLDFAGMQFAKKLPRVLGIVIETFFGGIVEIVLFMILIVQHQGVEEGQRNYIPVILAAAVGSLLANLLLCLGGCFLVGGIKYKQQTFHQVVSETGSGLLLVAGFALLIPSAFYSALSGHTVDNSSNPDAFDADRLDRQTLLLSRATSIVLMFAFFLYLVFNIFSHSTIFDEVLGNDEERDRDRHEDLKKSRLTMTEAVVAILFSATIVAFMAFFLVYCIEPLVHDYGVHDNFLGLILIPLAEKAAEHLSAIDEAYDNQINFALFHCLAPSIQTALFNIPLVVIVGWGLDKTMSLNFEIFFVVLLVLSILVVGNFLRDGSSDYLEGALLLIVYLIIALAAWYYPNPAQITTNITSTQEGSGGEGTAETTEHAIRLAKRMIEAGFFREL